MADETIAAALLPERAWDAMLVDYDAARNMMAQGGVGALDVPRRIVLITPAERPALTALKEAGFTGYLIKPVRAVSLAARFAAEDRFEHQADDAGGKEKFGRGDDEAPRAFRSWLPRTTRSTRCWRGRCWRGSVTARRSSATGLPRCMPSSLRAKRATLTICC